MDVQGSAGVINMIVNHHIHSFSFGTRSPSKPSLCNSFNALPHQYQQISSQAGIPSGFQKLKQNSKPLIPPRLNQQLSIRGKKNSSLHQVLKQNSFSSNNLQVNNTHNTNEVQSLLQPATKQNTSNNILSGYLANSPSGVNNNFPKKSSLLDLRQGNKIFKPLTPQDQNRKPLPKTIAITPLISFFPSPLSILNSQKHGHIPSQLKKLPQNGVSSHQELNPIVQEKEQKHGRLSLKMMNQVSSRVKHSYSISYLPQAAGYGVDSPIRFKQQSIASRDVFPILDSGNKSILPLINGNSIQNNYNRQQKVNSISFQNHLSLSNEQDISHRNETLCDKCSSRNDLEQQQNVIPFQNSYSIGNLDNNQERAVLDIQRTNTQTNQIQDLDQQQLQDENKLNKVTREKLFRISKTQVIFPQRKRLISDTQDTLKDIFRTQVTLTQVLGQTNGKGSEEFDEFDMSEVQKNSQEDRLIMQKKANTQPESDLRKQMSLNTPPYIRRSDQLEQTTRQAFRIKQLHPPRNQSNRITASSKIKETVLDDCISKKPIDISMNYPNFKNQEQSIQQLHEENGENIKIDMNKPKQKLIAKQQELLVMPQKIVLKPFLDRRKTIIPPNTQNNSNNSSKMIVMTRKNNQQQKQRQIELSKKSKQKMNRSETSQYIKQNEESIHKEYTNRSKHENDQKDHIILDFHQNVVHNQMESNDQQFFNEDEIKTCLNDKRSNLVSPAASLRSQKVLLSSFNADATAASAANILLSKGTLSIKKVSSNEWVDQSEDIASRSLKSFQDVELREVLGEGACGKVYKGFLKQTGKFIAVKQLRVSTCKSDDQSKLQQYMKEIIFLYHLDHPHIIHYYDCRSEGDFVYIYMEQMIGGSIAQMLEKFGRFDEALIKKFVKQIMLGLVYLHSQGIVHRDIKGANILSDGNGIVKLADFGAARYRDIVSLQTALSSSEVCSSVKGSLYWMAPELMNQEPYGRKSDIWSLGCTLIEMATAKHPWPDCKSLPQLSQTVRLNKCPPIPSELSESCRDFVQKCCTFDKKLRPTAESLLSHPFLTN